MTNPSQNSIDYYREREQHEFRLAHVSSQAIRTMHLEMADSYRRMTEKPAAFGLQHGTPPPFDEICNVR